MVDMNFRIRYERRWPLENQFVPNSYAAADNEQIQTAMFVIGSGLLSLRRVTHTFFPAQITNSSPGR